MLGGRNSDEVGNVTRLKAVSVSLVFGLLELVVAARGDTLHFSPSGGRSMCVTPHFGQMNSVLNSAACY